jgi:uncharacterized membrane protein
LNTFAARTLLALAYPVLAHLASARGSGALAALALGDIVLIVLLPALVHPRTWAWGLAAALAAGLVWLARTSWTLLPLLLVPAAFVALVGWGFARTLRAGRVPLITRIVAALDTAAPAALSPVLQSYTRGLTAAWAVLLFGLAAVNLGLALVAAPDGVLLRLGLAPPLTVTEAQWSWFAHVANYGLVGGFFLAEFAWRQRRFPGRYRNLADFLRRMARLGPGFWRDLLRS